MRLSTLASRRQFLQSSAALAALAAGQRWSRADQPVEAGLGVVIHSYGIRSGVSKDRHEQPPFATPARFLEYCHGLGFQGIQIGLGAPSEAEATKLRKQAEQWGMYLEGSISAPKNTSDVERFTAEVRAAQQSGANVLRCALLSGRRYEIFDTADAFQKYKQDSWTSLTLAAPVVEKANVRLAIENHKDYRSDELFDVMKKLGSAQVGVCLDAGNNIALLENPDQTLATLAPITFTTHIKDMGVTEYEDGFLLSEVPLGEGLLNLKKFVATIRQANPAARFNLEMITRDPLKIPCLTDKYWATFDKVAGKDLAATLALVRKHPPKQALPKVTGLSTDEKLAAEDEYVRRSLKYWNQM